MLPRTCLYKSSDRNLKLQNQKSTDRVLTPQVWKQSSTNQKSHPAVDCVLKEILIQVILRPSLPILAGICKHYCPELCTTAARLLCSVREPVLQSTSTKILTWKCWDQGIKTQTPRFRSSHLFAYWQKFLLSTTFLRGWALTGLLIINNASATQS